jgi:glutathione synthase/RimK-type ligase-like ATP-grasp enzyme
MLLILSDNFDIHANIVESKIANSIKYFRFNLDVESLKNTIITYNNTIWIIKQKDIEIKSSDISCVWCRRPFVELTIEENINLQDIDFKIWKNEWNATLLGLYTSLKSKKWLNPLTNAFRGENKYYQREIADKIGLKMPSTLVSNNKNNLIDFAKKCNNNVILKLMKQDIYQCPDGEMRGFYTNRIGVEHLENFSTTEENPVVLQKYIEKNFEVRYTVVGNEHLVCKIDSQKSQKAKNDWRRYDLTKTPHVSITPPYDIKNKIEQFLKELGLEYGAIDFIVTPDNEWIFLEINCFGQWLWIEDLTGLDISGAICSWIYKNIKI